jgi:HD-like signal output (HDOD) protein
MSPTADLTSFALDDNERQSLSRAGTSVPALLSQLTGVKPYPAVVQKIRTAAYSPTATVADVAAVVESDIAFAARMLRLVNSASVGLSSRCTTVKHAVALLGVSKVAEVAAAAAALSMVQEDSPETRGILGRSLGAATIARDLAPYAGVGADDAFTAALLHDVGELLLLQSKDAAFREIFAQSPDPSDERCAVEREKLGLDHALLGASVLSTWHIPAPIPEVILRHHSWTSALKRGGEVAKFVALLRVSDLLAVRTCARAEPIEEDLAALRGEPGVQFLGLTCEDLVRMWPQLRAAESMGRNLAGPTAKAAAPTPASPLAAPVAPEHHSIAPVVPIRSLRSWLALIAVAICVVSIAVVVPLLRQAPAEPAAAAQVAAPAAHP